MNLMLPFVQQRLILNKHTMQSRQNSLTGVMPTSASLQRSMTRTSSNFFDVDPAKLKTWLVNLYSRDV